MIEVILFYVFAALTLGGAILTITRRNAVMCAVWLTVSLLGVAGIFLLQGAEFLFIAQIILYIGGITLLFLFVIMLVNLEVSSISRQFNRAWPILLLAGLGLAAELSSFFIGGKNPSRPPLDGTAEVIADILFSRYFVAFELVSFFLLAAIIGSVWLGQERKKNA